MSARERHSALKTIRSNIARHGYHVYVVTGGPSPRFVYTIGLSEKLGAELVLAGAVSYDADDVATILRKFAKHLRADRDWRKASLEVGRHGTFSLRHAHASWADELLLGALDFYDKQSISAWQIVPDRDHATIDVPDLSQPWSASAEPIWQWLRDPWPYPVPVQSIAATNLAAMRGERVTEAARWEEDEWEIFAGPGPEVTADEMCVVPLGTLIGHDKTVEAVTRLKIGGALMRKPKEVAWREWKKKGT